MPLPEIQMPSGILPFTAADHVITPDALYVQVDRQAGHTRSRRRFRSVPTIVNTSFEVTQAQLEVFFNWHESALIAGSLPFAANIAKIGPGTEWWKAFILNYTVEHTEGSHRTVKVQLKLVDTPYATGPVATTLAVEFIAALVTSADPSFGSALTVEFVAALETEADLGPTLSVEFFGRLYTQVDAGPTNPSMDVEFLCELQTTAVIEPGAQFDVEFVCALLNTVFVDTNLAVEFTAALVATSSTTAGYVAPATAVYKYAYMGGSPGGSSEAGVRAQSDGEIRSRANSDGWGTPSNWWAPTQPGIGATRWVRMVPLTGSAFNGASAAVNVWLDLSTSRSWFLVNPSTGMISLTARIDIASDPDGTNIVSTCAVTLDSEYNT